MANAPHLETGTYDVIRTRLQAQAGELTQRLSQLNQARKEVFGAIEIQLTGTDRIHTQNYCTARDIVAIDDLFLFGYNVHVGLRKGIEISDVFSAYHFVEGHFKPTDLSILDNPKFQADFQNLYRYYKDAFFSKFIRLGSYQYMLFQVSDNPQDIKAFKWLMQDGSLVYIDNRSEKEVRYPKQYEFSWTLATRDFQRHGEHPHVSILDRVFVETVGGDLTIKIEDNTADGLGIYREPVENIDQTLDDAEFYYADLGSLIALRIRPYQETDRFFIYNEKLQEVQRVEALGESGVLLPDNQGVVFPNGYYLQTGEFKIFEHTGEDQLFEKRIISPNGEDYLFVFYNRHSGIYTLLPYNLIEQSVATPILCNGYTLFPNGELAYFRAEDEPVKHHVLQIWQTPYISQEVAMGSHSSDSYLAKIGNKDLVKAMADCQQIIKLAGKEDNFADLYDDLVVECSEVLDKYYWIRSEETFELHEPLEALMEASRAAIEEFEKKKRIERSTQETQEKTRKEAEALFRKVHTVSFDRIETFVEALAELRALRGAVAGIGQLRYHDADLVQKLDEQAEVEQTKLSERCVEFLLQAEALNPYHERVAAFQKGMPELKTVSETKEFGEAVDQLGQDLELLMDIVSNLKIEDATHTTQIIERISDVFAQLNRVKAGLRRQQESLGKEEAVAEFGAKLKLLDQSILNYLDVSDTPDKCDAYLSRLIIQLEELESQFADFGEFLELIVEKREEVLNAFETRKRTLMEALSSKTATMERMADRMLKTIRNRSQQFDDLAQINSFFAADLLVEKVRDLAKQLNELGDSNKSSGVLTRLQTTREEVLQQFRDKKELYADGDHIIRLGQHPFAVNQQPLELTIVQREGELFYHLTGTQFYQRVEGEELLATKPVWQQALLSENESVYRSEYLAYAIFESWKKAGGRPEAWEEAVQAEASQRYQEGYTKGVHDLDAQAIVDALWSMDEALGLLRYLPAVRVYGRIAWWTQLKEEQRQDLSQQFAAARKVLSVFPAAPDFAYLRAELVKVITANGTEAWLPAELSVDQIGSYLFDQLTQSTKWATSVPAIQLQDRFNQFLGKKKRAKLFRESMDALGDRPLARFALGQRWLQGFVDQTEEPALSFWVPEAAWLLLEQEEELARQAAPYSVSLEGLHGAHSLLADGHYQLNYYQFVDRLSSYRAEVVPMFLHFHEQKRHLSQTMREQMRLSEFEPRVLSSFVRNKLIDSVYLPMIGDNLAKQIGTAGEQARTDRMGMLLLISPPGYGKTTLLEYIANRLGMIFMKINGPAIGHDVTSTDPATAPNLGARQELEKLNLAFEMGDNVMIYLDDIQHCHPEFLQKFISLCDGQRKIEGVWQGQAKTYDFRGKRVCVVMAGNPYTESGDRFQIPDMLANRADVFNLGDMIGQSETAFKMSYLENAAGAHPIVREISRKSIKDLRQLIEAAEGTLGQSPEFEADHSPDTVQDALAVMQHLLVVRDVILKVNQQYIQSATIADENREIPSFQLQGSYRNMNKLTEKVVPILNRKELETMILDHYVAESQTLTSGGEANLLQFKRMLGWQSTEEAARWDRIVEIFLEGQQQRNGMVPLLKQMEIFNATLASMRDWLEQTKK